MDTAQNFRNNINEKKKIVHLILANENQEGACAFGIPKRGKGND